jgi:hypothetical protein
VSDGIHLFLMLTCNRPLSQIGNIHGVG